MAQVGWQDGPGIRRLRAEQNISGSELARRIGVLPQTISRIERNERAASIDVLVKAARVLRVRVDDLLSDGTDNEASTQTTTDVAA